MLFIVLSTTRQTDFSLMAKTEQKNMKSLIKKPLVDMFYANIHRKKGWMYNLNLFNCCGSVMTKPIYHCLFLSLYTQPSLRGCHCCCILGNVVNGSTQSQLHLATVTEQCSRAKCLLFGLFELNPNTLTKAKRDKKKYMAKFASEYLLRWTIKQVKA